MENRQDRLFHKRTNSFTCYCNLWFMSLDKCVWLLTFYLLLIPTSDSTAEGQVRLVGPSPCYGRVEVFWRGKWGTVCDDGWNLRGAEVVCRQLHCGEAMDYVCRARFGEGTGQIWLAEVKCSGTERALRDCRFESGVARVCGHHEDSGVICMKPPKISVAPSGGVWWGQPVSVMCSVDSAFTEGIFFLRRFNETIETSKSNPATFTFTVLTTDQQGPFSCVYEETILEKTYSSPQSDAVMIPVSEGNPVVVPVVLVVGLSTAGAVLLLLCAVHRRRSNNQKAHQPRRKFCAWRAEEHDEANADRIHDSNDRANVSEIKDDEEHAAMYNNVEDPDDYESVEVEDDYENC